MAREYKMIEHSSTIEFSQMVSELLEDGWELYGYPFSAALSSKTIMSQALIRGFEPKQFQVIK